MTKSNNKEEDERRAAATPGRVEKVHGGTVVEAIAPEELESFNDADCKHESLTRDPTETEFNAFICDNKNCHEVILFSKT